MRPGLIVFKELSEYNSKKNGNFVNSNCHVSCLGSLWSNQHFLLTDSYGVVQSEKDELEQKYLHLLQILESEKTARWQLLQQCEEQAEQIKSLKNEVWKTINFI